MHPNRTKTINEDLAPYTQGPVCSCIKCLNVWIKCSTGQDTNFLLKPLRQDNSYGWVHLTFFPPLCMRRKPIISSLHTQLCPLLVPCPMATQVLSQLLHLLPCLNPLQWPQTSPANICKVSCQLESATSAGHLPELREGEEVSSKSNHARLPQGRAARAARPAHAT